VLTARCSSGIWRKPGLPKSSKKFYGHVNLFGHTDSHYAPHDTFFSVYVDQALVNSHLPLVPRCCSFSAWGFQHGNFQPLSRQWNRTVDLDSCFLGDNSQFSTYFFKLCVIRARQANSCFSYHRPSFLTFLLLDRFIEYLP